MTVKKKIAVFFGGRSPEHDVSVVTALQAMQALDPSLYDAFPVYIAPDGRWLTGDALRNRDNYIPDRNLVSQLTEVTLDLSAPLKKGGVLIAKKAPFLGQAKQIEFDCALLAFHGLFGEDGNMQGVFEFAGIPYTGMRTTASAVTMNKGLTKKIMVALGIPTLPYAMLKRPKDGYKIAPDELTAALKGLNFPLCVKPANLGSSIGVAKVKTVEELNAALPAIFKYDDEAIVEPFVENLVEYNVALCRKPEGEVLTSAIERPKNTEELLDFKQKYMSGGDNKTGTKNPGQLSEGMLSLTRELNPQIDPEMDKNIRQWATDLYNAMNGTGAPRIDFIGNSKTGEIWMNEVNPCPGSMGYFLWEAAQDPILFTDFLSAQIDEAFDCSRTKMLGADPVPMDARLHRRST